MVKYDEEIYMDRIFCPKCKEEINYEWSDLPDDNNWEEIEEYCPHCECKFTLSIERKFECTTKYDCMKNDNGHRFIKRLKNYEECEICGETRLVESEEDGN